MNKLSDRDKKRAMDDLAKCAAETKSIGDVRELNDRAYDILAKEIGDKPELIKRACESYNSVKSLYKFGEMGERRGDTFSILDPREVSNRVGKQMSDAFIKKAASANGIRHAQFTVISDKAEEPMKKTASAESMERKHAWQGSALPIRSMYKMSSAETVSEVNSCSDDIMEGIRKVARDREEAIQAMTDAEERFIAAMATETPVMQKQAAEMLSNAYGDLGRLLVDLFNASPGHRKIANYDPNKYVGSVRLPDTVLFKSAADVLEAHAMKYVADEMEKSFLEDAVDYVKDVFAARTGIKKEAAGIGSLDMIASMVGAKQIAEKITPQEGTKSDIDLENEINTTELINTLKQHSVKRAFMNTVTDSTVARYPLHQVTQAFNEALSELPLHMRDLPPTAFSALLKSRTIARLGRGGAASGSDVDQIQQIQQAFGRVRPDDITTYSKRK